MPLPHSYDHHLHIHIQLPPPQTTTTHCKLLKLKWCMYIYIYIPPPPDTYNYVRTTIIDHHHTVQVTRMQVQYLRQWLDEKAPPAQVATGDNHHLCT